MADWFEENKEKKTSSQSGNWFEEHKPGADSNDYTLSGFLNNALSSGGNMIKGIVSAVTSPLQTSKALGNLAVGAGQKLIPGTQGKEVYADALIKEYADRYGSWDNFTKTLYNDPVGVMADLSTVLGGGSAALKGLGIAAKTGGLGETAQALRTAGKIAGTASEVSDPMRVLGTIRRSIPGQEVLARRAYQSALKPSQRAQNLPRIASEISTGIAEKLPVSESGLEKLSNSIMDMQTAITAEVSKAKGKVISAEKVASRLGETAEKFSRQVNPAGDVRAISRARREFLNKYAIKDDKGKIIAYKDIPVEEAQASKVATYQALKDKSYGELKGAAIEAQKTLARGLKEELATAIPELAELNARESKLLQLEPILQKAIERIRNHQIFGIGTPIAAGGIHAMTGSTKAALVAGVLRGVIEQPQVKSRLAIAIDQVRKRKIGQYGRPTIGTGLSRVQEYIDSLKAYEGASNAR